MSRKPPLSAFSEVVDERRRWTPDWYSWLSDIEEPRKFAALPKQPVVGMEFDISDCNTATWGAVATGGGTTSAKIRWNGTNWTVLGI